MRPSFRRSEAFCSIPKSDAKEQLEHPSVSAKKKGVLDDKNAFQGVGTVDQF